VEGVKAQDWIYSYRDGTCGIRKLDDDMDTSDPKLESFTPEDRSNCSNVADNPLHDTPPDQLYGVLRVVQSRRAKHVAVSLLTPDLVGTTGVLQSFEGGVEDAAGAPLEMAAVMLDTGAFGLRAGARLGSTFARPVVAEGFQTAGDYETRFWQYTQDFNDRATYSLACVIDGECPVNFKDQIRA